MSRTIALSQVVPTLFFSFVVTTPHHCCSTANVAWDPLASVGRMLTIFGFWLAAETALAFILKVSLQVCRQPVSMFTTYLLPARDVRWLSHLKGFPLVGGMLALEDLDIRWVMSLWFH